MAATVYRYKFASLPGSELSRFVPGATVLGSTAPGIYVDVTADSAYKADLDDYMALQGWTYDSTSPATTVDVAAATSAKRLIEKFIDAPAEGWPSGVYRECTGGVFPTSIIWWTTSGKTVKILEKTITWTGVNPTTVAWKLYDAAGTTVIITATDTISYSGASETSRTRNFS